MCEILPRLRTKYIILYVYILFISPERKRMVSIIITIYSLWMVMVLCTSFNIILTFSQEKRTPTEYTNGLTIIKKTQQVVVIVIISSAFKDYFTIVFICKRAHEHICRRYQRYKQTVRLRLDLQLCQLLIVYLFIICSTFKHLQIYTCVIVFSYHNEILRITSVALLLAHFVK